MKIPQGNRRVAVAMSGGVDSSVAAGLLVRQGYDVFGLMMRLWSEPGNGQTVAQNRCCTPDQMADARRVADLLGIPFYVLDVKDYFRATVVDFFVEQHAQGRTPNPCIECNRRIRFGYLLAKSLDMGASYLATGHYARVVRGADGLQLLKAVDGDKDQSYVLHLLNQDQLARVLFPVGDYSKQEVRQLAREMQLPVAGKSESMDLCFLRDGDYRRFLAERAPGLSVPGPIVDGEGRRLGIHSGLPNYTIGQRKGLGIAVGQPVYVLGKDAAANSLIVGPQEDLGKHSLAVRRTSWLSGHPPRPGLSVEVKIRYRARPASGRVFPDIKGRTRIEFDRPVYGATAGQGAVFYSGDVCLGGGIIEDEVNP